MRTLKKTPPQLDCYLLLADAVIITDDEHAIITVNESYEKTTGYEQEYIIGHKAGFLKSGLTPQSTYHSLKQQLKEGKPWSGVFINLKKSKEIWHSTITITPISVNDETYFVGIFRELEQLPQGVYLSENKRIETQRELLKVLAISCEIRDPSIEDHLCKVQELTEKLILAHQKHHHLKLEEWYIHDVIHGSILHDIGKAEIPEGILYKPGPLSHYERKIIEMHPFMGADILSKISKELSNDVIKSFEVPKNIVLYHHEKWDGTGYPYQLKGEDIPLEARIIAIVDVYDALTSQRPYKDSWPKEKALTFINEQKGKHFDPMLVETFVEYLGEDEV